MRWPWIRKASVDLMLDQLQAAHDREMETARFVITLIGHCHANAIKGLSDEARVLHHSLAESDALLVAERHAKGLPAVSTGENAFEADPLGR